ncbi:MAG: DnaJ domain-containing protein [Deltaproteobacteria bacterium]|nr:DnaJ domain-containing protein [Deltaproteobacteria bacterium]
MADFASKTYYEILGVSPDASVEEIKEAYRQIARAYHPDSNFYDEILSNAKENIPDSDIFKKITDAYNTLINDERRKEYDKLFPKGLRDWDDIERNVPQEDLVGKGFSNTGSAASIYRPRGHTSTFRRSKFGVVENVPNEPAVEREVRGRSIQPIELPSERNIVPWFIALLVLGFIAGGILAYYVVSRG